MEAVDIIMKYVILPVAAFVWMLYQKIQSQHIDLEVLKAQASANKESHDREFKEMRDNFKRVFEKLDGIEGALRK